MRAVIFVTFAFLAGCAGSIERVQAMRDSAPDWYEARKVELAGNGYPSIADIPTIGSNQPIINRLGLSEAETLAALDRFKSDPRGMGAEETAAEMRAWSLASRRAVEGQIPPPDFLTDEDIAELRAIFNHPRGRL